MIGLTHRQRRCLQFIKQYTQESGGVSPSMQEISDALGWKAKSNAHYVLTGLEERGYIRRMPNRTRAIQIIKPTISASINGEPLRFIPIHAIGISRMERPDHVA